MDKYREEDLRSKLADKLQRDAAAKIQKDYNKIKTFKIRLANRTHDIHTNHIPTSYCIELSLPLIQNNEFRKEEDIATEHAALIKKAEAISLSAPGPGRSSRRRGRSSTRTSSTWSWL